jgi:site-specific recombinase XerD
MIAPSLPPVDEDLEIVATLPPRLREALDGYSRALDEADLAPSTRRVYLSRVIGYLDWLTESDEAGRALRDPLARNRAVSAYQRWLRDEQGRAPSAVNAVLVAVSDFYRHLGLGAPVVARDQVTAVGTPGLDRAAVAAVEESLGTGAGSAEAAREAVIVALMRYAGLSGPEVAALDVDDVRVAGDDAQVRVAGRAARDVPLHSKLAAALRAWLRARADWPGAAGTPALLLNRFGERLGARSVTGIVAQVGSRAGVEVSPAALRATFAETLDAAGVSAGVIAALTGRRVPGYDAPSPTALRAAVRRLGPRR